MIHFKKKEKTRADFGQMMDYFLEKDWLHGYFINKEIVTHCGNIIKGFCDANNIAKEKSFLRLLLNQESFLQSKDCDLLLKSVAENCYHLPFYTIECYNDDVLCFSNYYFDEIYEDAKLPYYYILYRNDYFGEGRSCFLINKNTGKLHSFEMNSIIPSENLNILFGQFNFSNLDRERHYKIIFDLMENGVEINEKSFVAVEIINLIDIPEELSKWTDLSFFTIAPNSTNIDCTIIPVEQSDDIEFREKLLELRNNFFLPF